MAELAHNDGGTESHSRGLVAIDPAIAAGSGPHERAPLVRFLDELDRARLAPMDVLLLLRLAEAEVTVLQLADELDRRPETIRRAAAGLVARGLVRRRSHGTERWAHVFTATPRGLDVLRRLRPPLRSEITAPAQRGGPPAVRATVDGAPMIRRQGSTGRHAFSMEPERVSRG
jgi:DNA-binding MarR family transcriptional regulator